MGGSDSADQPGPRLLSLSRWYPAQPGWDTSGQGYLRRQACSVCWMCLEPHVAEEEAEPRVTHSVWQANESEGFLIEGAATYRTSTYRDPTACQENICYCFSH